MHEKLLAIQKEIGAIKKDSKNPFFKSSYFDINSLLAEVKPILNKHGLVLLQPITASEGCTQAHLTTILMDGKEQLSWSTPIPTLEDAQKMGSVITYFRRYALQSLLALEAEDDDGETAVGRPTKKAYPTPKSEGLDLDEPPF